MRYGLQQPHGFVRMTDARIYRAADRRPLRAVATGVVTLQPAAMVRLKRAVGASGRDAHETQDAVNRIATGISRSRPYLFNMA